MLVDLSARGWDDNVCQSLKMYDLCDVLCNFIESVLLHGRSACTTGTTGGRAARGDGLERNRDVDRLMRTARKNGRSGGKVGSSARQSMNDLVRPVNFNAYIWTANSSAAPLCHFIKKVATGGFATNATKHDAVKKRIATKSARAMYMGG